MEEGKIRSVSYKIFDNEGKPRDMVFQVGSKHNVGMNSDNTPIRKEVCAIVQDDKRIKIFLKEENDVQLWKDIPLNEYVTLEYEND